jgi:hypothetical protein
MKASEPAAILYDGHGGHLLILSCHGSGPASGFSGAARSRYVEHVLVIAEAVRARIPLRQVSLVLFARGLPVDVELLRAAYFDLFTQVTREMLKITGTGGRGPGEPDDQTDLLAIRWAAWTRGGPAFRQWQVRARRLAHSGQVPEASSARSLLAGALSAALTGPVTGAAASAEGIAEALAVFGLAPDAAARGAVPA